MPIMSVSKKYLVLSEFFIKHVDLSKLETTLVDAFNPQFTKEYAKGKFVYFDRLNRGM